MNGKFDAFDGNGNEIVVDTTDFKLSPSGCAVEIMTYPKKGLSDDRPGKYQNYKTILGQIPREKREEFEKICKKILSNKKSEKKKNEKELVLCCAIVRQAKIEIQV